MNRYLKFFEYAYIVFAILSIVEVVRSWGVDQDRVYIFMFFTVLFTFLFFFRRRFRKKFEKRKREQQGQ
ncbi:hypothetical protein GCM10009117_16820 [Gangjinia marincola]|uniref:Uncharacterized protein n=1 Tax=Gangjinia marincola TaxID=578463 RepID=A0ABN1MHD4_9FLAO